MKKPARSKPTDTVNRATLARMMGVSLPTIDDWQRRGCPVVATGSKGRSYSFNVQAVVEWRVTDERRRQGLPAAAALINADKPTYNPLRALAHDAAVSVAQFFYSVPMVEDMIGTVRKQTGCDERAAKKTVAGIFTLHWITLSVWVEQDRFSRELVARGDMDFDSQVLKINSRAQFIPGPIPIDALERGEHTPEVIQDLFTEVFGQPPIEEAGRPKR